jgi:protein TonB
VPTLDVILTQTSTVEKADNPDFIAQANNKGGGDRDEAQRPRDQLSAQVPKPDPGVAPQPLTAQAPPPAPEPTTRILTTVGASAAKTPLPEDRPDSEPKPLPTGAELMQQSIEMARLQAEISRQQELYAKRPKKKFISASTQAYEYAEYMRAWVEKVERIGNLNFPEEARRQGLSGRLIMTVSVARNGEVKGVVLQRSSGRRILDDAAVRVVHLASPFNPLPHTSEDVDILEITRTWDYKNGSVESE